MVHSVAIIWPDDATYVITVHWYTMYTVNGHKVELLFYMDYFVKIFWNEVAVYRPEEGLGRNLGNEQ